MIPMPLIMAGLSAGGALMSGIGAANASAKQARLQKAADDIAETRNQMKIDEVNRQRRELGRELLDIEEVHEVTTRQTGGTQRGSDRQRVAETRRSGWVDVDKMMADAERAGFNPTTWLNAGAMSAYAQAYERTDDNESIREWDYTDMLTAQTTRSRGHNAAEAFKMMLPEYHLSNASQVPQQQNMLQALGGALSSGASAFGNQYRADQSYDLQLARMLAGNANQGMGMSDNNGLSTTLSFGAGGSPAADGAAKAGGVSDLAVPLKQGDAEVTNTSTRGSVDSTVPNAEAYEDRYGQLGEAIGGVSNVLNDGVRNFTGRSLRDWGKAAGMNIGDYKQPTDKTWLPAFSRWWTSPSSFPSYISAPPPALPNVGYPM